MPEPIDVLTADHSRFHQVTFDQPVPRHLVHRAAIAEVFVTDGLDLGGDRFVAGAQWPRDHAFYHPGTGGDPDPLLFAETIRQAMVYLAHRFHDVPLGARFTGRDIAWELTDTGPLRARGEPVAVLLDVRWTWLGKGRRRFRLDVTLTAGGRACGHGHIGVAVLDERRYQILRGRNAPGAPGGHAVPAHRVAAPHVGRLRAKDVVVGRDATGDGWRLLLDQSHPALFDHPVDHAPLMGLAEGVRQLGHLLVHNGGGSWSLTSFEAAFAAFTELDQPTSLTVRSHQPDPAEPSRTLLDIDVEQAHATVATTRSVWSAGTRQSG